MLLESATQSCVNKSAIMANSSEEVVAPAANEDTTPLVSVAPTIPPVEGAVPAVQSSEAVVPAVPPTETILPAIPHVEETLAPVTPLAVTHVKEPVVQRVEETSISVMPRVEETTISTVPPVLPRVEESVGHTGPLVEIITPVVPHVKAVAPVFPRVEAITPVIPHVGETTVIPTVEAIPHVVPRIEGTVYPIISPIKTAVTFNAQPKDHCTFSGRHPEKTVIQPAHNHKKQKMNRPTKAAMRAAWEEKSTALNDAIKRYLDQQGQDIQEIAEAHNLKPEKVKTLLNHKSLYKKKRKPSLHNAKVHWKSMELNDGRPFGARNQLKTIYEEIDKDPALKNPTPEFTKTLLDSLKAHRDVQQRGARINNRAANHDFQNTVSRLNAEVENLTEHTGVVGFTLFARGNVNDTAFPCWGSVNRTENFCTEVLDTTPGELSRKFDAWAIARPEDENKYLKLRRLQAECSRIIVEGLREITNRPDARMSYKKYNANVRLIHKVELCTWPCGIVFTAPSNISGMSDVLLLLQALKDGECIWVTMSSQKVNELASEFKAHEKKEKAPRKDKGGTHAKSRKRKGRDENDDPTGTNPPAKKPRGQCKVSSKSQLPPMAMPQRQVDEENGSGDEVA